LSTSCFYFGYSIIRTDSILLGVDSNVLYCYEIPARGKRF
jgi:hypothetical protein